MSKQFFMGVKKLGSELKLFSHPKIDYSTYGIALNNEKASNLTRGDDNCITEGSGNSWMSSTW